MRAIRVLGAAGVVAIAVSLAPVAQAAGHWYGRVDLSYNHLSDNGWDSPNGFVSTQSSTGTGLDLALGRDLGRVWAGGAVRGEFEFAWKYNGIDTFTQNGRQLTGVTGHTRMVALMYNLYNDFAPESTFDPYLGAGIGYAYVHYGNYYGYDQSTNTSSRFDGSDSVFAYQLMAGFKVHFSDSVALDFAYDWFVLSNPVVNSGATKTEERYRTNSLALGLTWNF